jgi:hypothetical protein
MSSKPRHRLRRSLTALLAAGGIGAAALALPVRVRAQTLEYPIKAAFLVKFGEFVVWPAETFAVSGGALNICVVGDSDFAATVGAAIKGETVAGRQVAAQPLASIAPTDPCHIAYLSGSAKQSVGEALKAVSGRPVLTVTDESRTASAAGIIHFVIRNNRVRFAIDDRAAAANGLTLSSALLNIAVSVQRRN